MYQDFFYNIIYSLILLLCALFVVILIYVFIKNQHAKERAKWHQLISDLISKALFDEQPDLAFVGRMGKLALHRRFRTCLLHEIIQTKKQLAGDAGARLKKLYELFKLNKDSDVKLNSLRWHIKAKGIQELSLMQQTCHVKRIFRLTNYKNELVRNEAQCGLINFYGFRGLRFLNVMVHTLSQWQQIQLLNKLNGALPEDMSTINKWLKSRNESVVEFALKLATHYNYTEVYDDVISCLKLSGQQVRIQAINYLKKMPTSETGDMILQDYQLQSRQTRLFILDALKEIGNENHVPFLIGQLHESDEEVLSEILATLLILNPPGSLQSSILNLNPQPSLVHRFNNEHAA